MSAVLTAQVTLLLSLALAMAWSGRRGASRTLHLLWTATFALVLALPVLGLLGPSWEVPLLPARGSESAPASIPGSVEAAATIPALEIDRTRESLVLAERARLAARADGVGSASANAATGRSVARVAWIVWLVGCALSLVSLAIAALRLRKLVRTARPVCDPKWVDQAEALRHRLGLRGGIRLFSSEAVATPMTGGLWRPVILLPASAATWTRERRAVVLTHELIHVRRRDALRQLVRRAVLALYWFHPLAWIASRRATLASEKACDEDVLALGARPSDYARHLLFLATGLSRGPRALALPIVHPSQLERRITSILASRRPRPSLTRAALTLTVLAAAGVFVAAARPVPVEEEGAGAAVEGPGAVPVEGQREVVGQLAAREADLVAARAAAVRAAAPAALQEVECFPSSDSIRSFAFRGDGGVVSGWKWMDGGFTIARPVAGMRLCMRGEGEFILNAEGTAVRSLADDSWLVVESTGERTHRLVVTRGPEGIEREWSIDGARRPFDAEARRWRHLMFTVMNRYRDAWFSYAGGLVLYGRISGYRSELSDLQSARRDARPAEVLRELEQDLVGWEMGLRRITEGIRRSDLDAQFAEIAGRIADIDFAAASLMTDIEASDLERRLLEVSELVKREAGTPDLEQRLEEAERSLQDVLAELQRVTR
ncbi:M56 family metallopeptidase [Candidatus Palauibacter sp.]|uniref:M56 family metallopeptidase n=1 Tax=Candidatus Palauibacter sp. TaxID=3101350 RepID=UPI003B02D76D